MQQRSQRASIAEPQGSDNIHELASYLQQCCPTTLAYWPRTTFGPRGPIGRKARLPEEDFQGCVKLCAPDRLHGTTVGLMAEHPARAQQIMLNLKAQRPYSNLLPDGTNKLARWPRTIIWSRTKTKKKARAAALQAKRAVQHLGRIHQFERAKMSHNCAA